MAEAPSDLPHAMRRMEADLPFQHRSWQVERLSWAMLLVLVAAGLLGIFGGSGPLVAATALTPDEAIRLRYERVQRLLLRTTLLVELPRARPDGQWNCVWGRRCWRAGKSMEPCPPRWCRAAARMA
ncbi:hypothetical protein ACFQU2_19765 [Siccirubricoccus deserti]